jgi:hypothetical protein
MKKVEFSLRKENDMFFVGLRDAIIGMDHGMFLIKSERV